MMAALHDPLPVIMHERDHDVWLDPKNLQTGKLPKLIVPNSSALGR